MSNPTTAVKQDVIVASLLEQIQSGRLASGARLPTRQVLETEYGASRVTVQRAFDRLMELGYVESRGRRGTFVCESLPHLTRVALVAPVLPQTNLFWQTVTRRVQAVAESTGRQMPIYHVLINDEGGPDYARYLADLETHSLAGQILVTVPNPAWWRGPAWRRDLPTVVLQGAGPKGVPRIVFPASQWIEMAMDRVLEMGCERLAILVNASMGRKTAETYAAAAAKRGLTLLPEHVQGVPLYGAHWGRQVCQLMMSQDASRRPQALLIVDDNLVAPACHGVADAGVTIGEELLVIGHGNLPLTAPDPWPILRLGYEIDDMIHLCLATLERLRDGETTVEVMEFSPHFANCYANTDT